MKLQRDRKRQVPGSATVPVAVSGVPLDTFLFEVYGDGGHIFQLTFPLKSAFSNLKWCKFIAFLAFTLCLGQQFSNQLFAADAAVLYENNFEKADVGKVPDDFLVIDGDFTVKEENGNKFLELPGAPLDSYGLLFGPTVKPDVAVSARVFGTKKGRRFPTFAVGLGGQNGYRLQVSPAKGKLEIYKGDDILASVDYEWKSGEWTMLELQIIKSGDVWKLEGRAWTQGATEPLPPVVAFEEKEEPKPGRASIWGSPISTTPIQYDDLAIKSVKGN